MIAEYSIENGYYVTYKEKSKKIIASINIRVLKKGKAIQKLVKPIKKASEKKFVLTPTVTGISIQINTLDFQIAQRIVADITKELLAAGYQQSCFYTGLDMDVSLYRVGKEMVVANETAVREHVNKTNKDNAREINPVLGLLGGVIGILIGVTIWLIISMLGYFIWWVGFLIIILGIQGFKLLGKGVTRGWGILLVIMGIIGIVFAQFLETGMLIFYASYTGGSVLSVKEIVAYMWLILSYDAEARSTFFTNLILGLVLGGAGMLAALPTIPTKAERDEELVCTRIA